MRYLAVSVFLLALTAGCIGGDVNTMDPEEVDILGEDGPATEEVETNETGGEILGTAVEAVDGAETRSFDTESRMGFGASWVSMTVSMDSEGEAEADEIGYVSTEGSIHGEFVGLGNTTDFETETYVSPTRTHRRSSEAGDEMGNWSTTETGLDDGGLTVGAEGLTEIAEKADAEVEGTGSVGGEETYVLSLDVGPEELTRHSAEIFDAHAVDGSDEFDPDEGDEGIDEEDTSELEAYLWVDRETREPVRFSYYLLLGGSDDGPDDEDGSDGSPGFEVYFDAEYSYGGPVDAEPPEAN